MKLKEIDSFMLKHPKLLLCIMIAIHALFIYGWWPRSSQGETAFRWTQLVFIAIADIGVIHEFIKCKHNKN
jgi:hypothetical protein